MEPITIAAAVAAPVVVGWFVQRRARRRKAKANDYLTTLAQTGASQRQQMKTVSEQYKQDVHQLTRR